MRCRRCPNPELVEITLNVGEEALTMYRCTRCDAKVWNGSDGHVSLERVLDLARSSR
jgi:uncharacterized protein with PIN domain